MIKEMKEILSLFNNPIIYLIIAFIILICSSGKNYVNISGIVKNYFKKFIKENYKIFPIMFIFPFLLSVATALIKELNSNLLEIITVAISILMSLFFTYLSFFQNLQKENSERKGNYNLKKQNSDYAEETKSVASYEIFISILILILCFVYPINEGKIMSIIIYFLFYHLLINLLVLLKRYNNNL